MHPKPSNQRAWQIKQASLGNCEICGKPKEIKEAVRCHSCAVRYNEYKRKRLEFEPEAREAFIKHTGLSVVEVGFVTRDDTIVGCSPDFLIVDAQGNYIAGGEMKCPIPATHVGYVLDGKLPDDYKQQVHGGMAVTGLNQWHFWSYFPGMQPFHLVVHRDEYTEKLSRSLDEFVILYQQAREKVIPKLRLAKEDAE